MEKKTLSVEEIVKFENELKKAEEDPFKFFTGISARYNKFELSSLLGYFLANTKDIKLIRITIK